jgi:hypothetical protein
MKDTEMDRILSKQDEIVPSSGFTASVMEAVRREAEAPAPIPFPWKRALPVLVLAAAAIVLVGIVGVAAVVQLSHGSSVAQLPATPPLSLGPSSKAGGAAVWTALALLMAFISVKISLRLAGARA